MKKKSILFSIALMYTLAISLTSYAQSNKLNIGIEGGPSIISLRHENVKQKNFHSPSIGYSVGIALQYNFKKRFSIHSAILFERKGAKTKKQGTDSLGKNTYMFNTFDNFDYLTLPLLVRANFGKKINLFINAGPYISYLIQQHSLIKFPEEAPFNNQQYTYTNSFYKMDYGISGGVGLAIPIKQKLVFSIEARNNLGLNNIQKLWYSTKTNSANLLLGVAYKFGERKEKSI